MKYNFKVLSTVENYKLASMLAEVGFEVSACKPVVTDVVEKCGVLYPGFLIINDSLFYSVRKTGIMVFFEMLEIKIITVPDNGDIDLKKLMHSILAEVEMLMTDDRSTRSSFKIAVDDMIDNALDELGFLSTYSGTPCIRAIMNAICFSKLRCTDSMSKVIYPYIAKRNAVTPESVERNIRTAIKNCWDSSDISVREKYFGKSFCKIISRPTNREFITVLGEYLLRKTEMLRFEFEDEEQK